jgi:hypothetical protein
VCVVPVESSMISSDAMTLHAVIADPAPGVEAEVQRREYHRANLRPRTWCSRCKVFNRTAGVVLVAAFPDLTGSPARIGTAGCAARGSG